MERYFLVGIVGICTLIIFSKIYDIVDGYENHN